MRRGLGYLPTEAIYPMRGLVTTTPSTLSHPSSSPVCENMLVSKGHVTKRKGYTILGIDPLVGTPMAIIDFRAANAIEWLVVITTSHLYKFDGDVWTDITGSCTWSGGETNIVNWTIAIGDQGLWLIATNGIDHPVYWDGISSSFMDITTHGDWVFTNFVTCRAITQFNNHLLLGNITDTSGNFQNDVAWSVTDSLANFSIAPAAIATVTNCNGAIIGLKALADRVVVYAEESIALATYVGDPQIFVFEQLLDNTRLLNAKCIVDLKSFHLYAGREDCMAFDGTRQPRTITDAIHFTYRDALNYDKKEYAFGFVDFPRNQVYFGVPTAIGGTDVYMLEYDALDLSNQRWTKLVYDRRPNCMGFFSSSEQMLWSSQSLIGVKWSDLSMSWNQLATTRGSVVRIIGFIDGVIGIARDIMSTDDGTGIDTTIDTIDFTVPIDYKSEQARWSQIELELSGTGSVIVQYSLNQGITFVDLETVNINQEWIKYKLDIDQVSRSLRVRVIGTGAMAYFEYRWVRVWFRAVGAR